MPHHVDFAEGLTQAETALPIVELYISTGTQLDQLVRAYDRDESTAQALYKLLAAANIVPVDPEDQAAIDYAKNQAVLFSTDYARGFADDKGGFSNIATNPTLVTERQ